MGCEPTLGGPLLFPSLSFTRSSSLSPFHIPIPHPFPSPPLEAGPLNQARRSVERYKLPSWVWSVAPAEIKFGAF